MRTAQLWGLTLLLTAFAAQASAQGTTQVASTPPEHAWWATTHTKPLVLSVRDQQKLASWYVEHLGFQLAGVAGPVPGGAQTPATTVYHEGIVLRLQRAKVDGPQKLVLTVADLDAQRRALTKAGIPLHEGRSLQLRDPEGNLIELRARAANDRAP